MGDKELSYNCRLELGKNEAKTSMPNSLPYSPARTITYEHQPLPLVGRVRVDPAYRVSTAYTPHDGLKSTYRETYKIPIQKDNFDFSHSKLLKQVRPYSKLGSQSKPMSFGTTEYRKEFTVKETPLPTQGISVEKLTTCPLVLTGRDERDALPLTGNYGKYLDIYLSETRAAHRAFTLYEQSTLAAKNIVTSQEVMDIPKGRGFGCKFPAHPGQDLDSRNKTMIDKAKFSSEHRIRHMPKGMPKVPNFGSESEVQAAYKKPSGVAIIHLFDRFIEFPQPINSPTAKQALCAPGMYATESSNIHNRTSPQTVV